MEINELKNLGINFSNIPTFKEEYIFSQIKSPNGVALYKNGIIFTGGADKGLLLEAFLKASNLELKKIIFIDDKKKNLDSVKTIAQKLQIEFLGIEYTAAVDSYIGPLNQINIKLKFEILEKEHKWLSDSEVEELLKQK